MNPRSGTEFCHKMQPARPRPIFIVGSGRSGTSVLTWIIGQHPNIIPTPETNWLTALASWSDGLYQIGNCVRPDGHFARWRVEVPAFLEQLGQASDMLVRNTFEARFPNRRTSLDEAGTNPHRLWFRSVDDPKTRWVDGTPSSSGFAGVLAQMFPEARFVNLVRDPQDVIRSWLAFSARASDLSDAQSVVEHVYHSQRAGYLAHAAFENRAIRVVYGDLIAEPEYEVRRITTFLDEEYDAECLKPLLGEHMNSSGEGPKVVAGTEFATIAGSPLLATMIAWFRAAQDPDWRIETAEHAVLELAKYAEFRIPIPRRS